MSLYKNKYRNESSRLKGWDYSNDGQYFITICTHDRQCLFGKVINGIMQLSEIGKIVHEEWNKSFEIRDELFCDVWILMPNHLHAIVRICGDCGDGRPSVRTELGDDCGAGRPAGRTGIAYRSPKSISSFIAGFKSSATKKINELRCMPRVPVWQTRFHDHIIRNEEEYIRIERYINVNPDKWEEDKFITE